MNQKQIEEILTLTNQLAIATIKAQPKNIVYRHTEKVYGQKTQETHRRGVQQRHLRKPTAQGQVRTQALRQLRGLQKHHQLPAHHRQQIRKGCGTVQYSLGSMIYSPRHSYSRRSTNSREASSSAPWSEKSSTWVAKSSRKAMKATVSISSAMGSWTAPKKLTLLLKISESTKQVTSSASSHCSIIAQEWPL